MHETLSKVLIDDSFRNLDSSTWKISGDAGPDSADRQIRLTQPETDSEGRLTLIDGVNVDVWSMTFNFIISEQTADPAESVAFWIYADADSAGYQPDDGYGIEFDHKNDVVRLVDVTDGVRDVLQTTNSVIKDESAILPRTNNVSFQYANGSLSVNMNQESVINYDFDFEDLNTEHKGLVFSAKTGSTDYAEHAVDDVRIVTPSNLVLNSALSQFDNNGIYSGPRSNTRRVIRTLLGGIEALAIDTKDIQDAHHIRHAHGRQLDKIARLVRLKRKEGENDQKFRLRIILAFRLNSSTGTFDELAQFMGVLLGTDPDNVDYTFNPESLPCTMIIGADAELFRASPLTNQEIIDFAGQTIEAGHRIQIQEVGTFVVIEDGDPVNDPDTGLTSDADTTVGGTLTTDLE
ncbi:lectin domain-containing protein [Haloarcula tailed virus 2]|uniref:Lectin domain-containing protein n=1 Tax=Haloarcula tailed virus 2 TaxID=2877989 RepID=A0AAE8XZU8_9CAUD|nr:lectin domain-containing protein [Haloarcula tailed virus 2]UBF23180.1 lectin domain-containing protein [Haloarcula tailed virus 2]